MTNSEFVTKLKTTAAMKTYYVKGGFGHVLNANNKKRLINQYKYNSDRADKINAQTSDTFAFDCCGLIKSLVWGFDGNKKKTYGGATYKANGLDDVNESGLLKLCTEVSTNMKSITPGECLFMSGHCGVYIGDGKVIECTPALKCGVQITDFNRVKWTKHGKLPQVSFTTKPTATKPNNTPKPTYYIVQRGDSLTSIAKKFGYKDWRTLWHKNKQIINPNLIYPGQKIII